MTLTERTESLSTKQLIACASALFINQVDGQDEKFQAILDELELRLPENEFAAFLDSDLQEAWKASEAY